MTIISNTRFNLVRWISLVLTSISLTFFMAATAASAQTFQVLYSFTGGSDGAAPEAGPIVTSAGNVYGTTHDGGGLNCYFNYIKYGCGTVFKLSASGKETVLAHFGNKLSGGNPESGLLEF